MKLVICICRMALITQFWTTISLGLKAQVFHTIVFQTFTIQRVTVEAILAQLRAHHFGHGKWELQEDGVGNNNNMKLFQNMKFLPESKRKTIILFSIVGVSAIGMVYFFFFYGRSAQPEVPSEVIIETLTRTETQIQTEPVLPDEAPSPGGIIPVPTDTTGAALSNGTFIDLTILDQDMFKILKSSPPVEITPEELGKDNPFVN